jgi:hypothetical protein
MGEVADLVCHQRAADAGVVGPAMHSRLEEGPIDDQLSATVEKVQEARPSVGSFEYVRLVDRCPWHPPALRSKRVTRPSERFLFHKHLSVGGLPLLSRDDRRGFHISPFVSLQRFPRQAIQQS